MSNALEKQADLLGSSLEEMESSISQLRDDMVGRLDDESGVLIATKEELTNLVGGERKEREAETAEIRAELATQLAASTATDRYAGPVSTSPPKVFPGIPRWCVLVNRFFFFPWGLGIPLGRVGPFLCTCKRTV